MVAGNRGIAIMSVTISLTDQDVFSALRGFLVAVLPSGVEVVQSQDNSVPMPLTQFVSMNNIGQRRMSTNKSTYADPVITTGTNTITSNIEYTMQLDLYGANSGAWAAMVQTLFRDAYGVSLFPVGITPLFADDPIQMTLIDGEEQYTQRWIMKAVMQYNPAIVVPQQFAASLTLGIKNVDASYPP